MAKYLWIVFLILDVFMSNAQRNPEFKNMKNKEDTCSVITLIQTEFENHVTFVAWQLEGLDSIAITQLTFWIYDEKERKGSYLSIDNVESVYPSLNDKVNKLIKTSGCSNFLYSNKTICLPQNKISSKIGESLTARQSYDLIMSGLSTITNKNADGYSYTINKGDTTFTVFWDHGRSQKVFSPKNKEFILLLGVIKAHEKL
jgi:hypothetical protein